MRGDWATLTALLLGVLIGSWLMSRDARATSFNRWENRRELAKGFRLLTDISILSSSENYSSTGAKVPASNVSPASTLESYGKTVIDLTGVYGFSEKMTGFARLSLAAVSYKTNTLEGNGSGLGEQALGLNYRMYESAAGRNADNSAKRRTSIDLQFQAEIPMYDNVSARAARTPLLGDGSLDLTFGPFVTMPLNQGMGSRIYLIGGLGYSIRGNDYSAALPYMLGVTSIPAGSGWLWKAGIHGFKSMTADPSVGTALATGADPRIDTGNSFIANALNSSYMALRGTLGYQTRTGSQYFAAYTMMLSGTSTAALSGIHLGMQWRWGTGAASSASDANSEAKGGAPAKGARSGFVSYDLDGRVKVSNDRLNLIKIDKGEQDGVMKGQTFDVFRTKQDGSIDVRIARGVVTNVGQRESIVNIRQYAKEVWIQPGYIVRRVIK